MTMSQLHLKCSKKYTLVTLKRTTYIFLWFCPHHGHCSGCHVNDGSEERKDPANFLILYLKVEPQVIFYDFAFSLGDYSFNRESGYFGNIQYNAIQVVEIFTKSF